MSANKSLGDRELEALDRDGFLVVEGVLTKDRVDEWVARLKLATERYLDELRSKPPIELPTGGQTIWPGESGVVRLRFDVDDSSFRELTEDAVVLSAARRVLAEPRLAEIGARIPMPGFGHQGLHQDLDEPASSKQWRAFTAKWVISRFDAETGTLRVIPGSHLKGIPEQDSQEWGWAMPPHPSELRIEASPGAVVLSNPQLWHSGTFNGSSEPRLSLSVGYVGVGP